ncbi:MAG TPA: PepSY domain-containing protein [Myxococcota bacterium]|nr:PepSY domain-containing protein [Myxococcota bacterium]
MRARRKLLWLHKWTALVVGLQLLLWVAGGLVMGVLDIEGVRGEATRAALELSPLRWGEIAPMSRIAEQVPLPIAELRVTTGPLGPRYRVTDTRGAVHRFDARTGRPLAELSQAEALTVAQAHYAGAGSGQPPTRLSERTSEYRGVLPVWRVDFDDAAATTLYVDVLDGDVVARRNRSWRIYDFAWMLHVMDYRERENFNHPLLVGAASLALAVTLSGLYLLASTPWRSAAAQSAKARRPSS